MSMDSAESQVSTGQEMICERAERKRLAVERKESNFISILL